MRSRSYIISATLGEICDEIYRYPTYYGIEYSEDGVPEIRGELLQPDGSINTSRQSWRFIAPKIAARFPKTKMREGDLVLSVRGTIGKVGIVSSDLTGANMTANLLRISPDRKRVWPRFLLRFMLSNEFQRSLSGYSTSTTINTIRVPELKSILVPLPSLTEQKRIAALLDEADALRRKRREALAKLDTLLQSVFLYMFGDPVTNSKNLNVGKIADYGDIVTGNTPSRAVQDYYGRGIEWIKSDNINTPYHILTGATEHLTESGQRVARIVPSGSILVTCIAGTPACIGNAAITDRSVAFNQQINAIVPFEKFDTYFLYGFCLVGKQLIQQSSTASMKGMVSKSSFSNINVIIPPQQTRCEFAETCQRIMKLADRFDDAVKQAENLFVSLQHSNFSNV